MKPLITVVFVFIFVVGIDSISPQKQKAIKGIRTRLTQYLTATQCEKVFDWIEDEIWNNKTAEEIMNGFVQAVLNVLTTSQKAELVQRGLKCSSESGVGLQDLLSRIGKVLKNNLMPFIKQMTALSTELRTKKGMKRDPVMVTLFRKTNQFILRKNIEKVICRVVASFNAKEWSGVKNNFGALILLDNYSCTKTTV